MSTRVRPTNTITLIDNYNDTIDFNFNPFGNDSVSIDTFECESFCFSSTESLNTLRELANTLNDFFDNLDSREAGNPG